MKLDETFLNLDAPLPEQSEKMLRVGAWEPRSMVAGPGVRAVLWVTGCNRRCPSCIKPEFLAFEAGQTVSIEEVYQRIMSTNNISGVTFSGGEPFEQAAGLGVLAKLIKEAGLNTLAYSGYSLAALQANPQRFGKLLNQLDWLIDGEFQANLPGPKQYLGSENQVLWKRQVDGSFLRQEAREQHDVQIAFESETIRVTGFPNRQFEKEFVQALSRRGIRLSPTPDRF